EEIYVAVAADLARDQHLRRPEGDGRLGEIFALRATVAYMGTWIRLGRSFARKTTLPDAGARAAKQFGAAVARLPDAAAFSAFPHFLIEGCLTTQPLTPLMGTELQTSRRPDAGMLVSVQARLTIEDQPVYVCAPALIGRPGADTRLLID